MSSVLETKRLILRQWQDSDYLPFAQLNADPYVMQYFPSPLSRDESGVMANKIRQLITDYKTRVGILGNRVKIFRGVYRFYRVK
jgi:RimJ/RimL family protein N-acetyltransferase